MKSFVRSVVRVAAAVLAVSQLGAGVAAAQATDLSVEKWVFGPGGPIAAGAPFVYSMFVANNGPDPVIAENVVVTDVLPAGVTFESAVVTYPEGASCPFDAPSNSAVVDVSYPGNANPAFPITTSQVVPYEMFVLNPNH